MKPLPILWRRLVRDGETCPRCGETGRELEAAVIKLRAALVPLGIEPVLETQEIREEAFQADTAESNRVWIAGKPIEDWLGGTVGMSPCCTACGDSDCRTIEIDGQTYEAIPQEQLIKAGLIAVSQMIASESSPDNVTESSCCGATGNPVTKPGGKAVCCG